MTGYSVKNRTKAYMYFFPECNGKCRKGWVLHHKDPSWKTEDPERYAEWRIEDLVPMMREEHMKLHSEGRTLSDEIKNKISESRKGIVFSEDHRHNLSNALTKYYEENEAKSPWNKGLKNCYSEETLENLRKSHTGQTHIFPDELKEKFSAERKGENNPFYGHTHSENAKKAIGEASKGKHYILGYHWWNNGKKQLTAKECPGEGWVRGRL